MKKTTLLIVCIVFATSLFAQYATPGNGEQYTLQTLVELSNGAVTNGYTINADLTISHPDTLLIETNEIITVADNVLISVDGTLLCTPPDLVTFKSSSETSYFLGFDFDDENNPEELSFSTITNTHFERCGGISIKNSQEMLFYHCSFTDFNEANASGAIDCFHASPIVLYCHIANNNYPAIASGANASSSPYVAFCTIENNVTLNENRPQINLGTSDGVSPIVLYGNNIIGGGYDQSGGISIATLAGGEIDAVIKNNTIQQHRYGINVYGYDITSAISNNNISENYHEDNPMAGGSGITYWGSNNISSVWQNEIRENLWGVTILGGATVDLGSDDVEGFNILVGNGNGGELYELYNNIPENTNAQHNYWGGDESVAAAGITDIADDPSLGEVVYLPILPYSPLTTVETPTVSAIIDGITYNGIVSEEQDSLLFQVPIGTDLSEVALEVSISYSQTVEVMTELYEGNQHLYNFTTPSFLTILPETGVGSNYLMVFEEVYVGIHTPKVAKEITFSPNPATHYITLSEYGNVAIYSLAGQLVLKADNVKKVDLSSLPKGCYLLETKTEKTSYATQLIKL